jgi:hypothetical protein
MTEPTAADVAQARTIIQQWYDCQCDLCLNFDRAVESGCLVPRIAQALAAAREDAEHRNLNADVACATAAEQEIDRLMAQIAVLEAALDNRRLQP